MDRWKEVESLDVDHILFVGDFVDSHDLDDRTIYNNFLDILSFKETHGDKVTLLLGNHDYHYLYFPFYRCSGFRESMKDMLHMTFKKNLGLFKMAARAGSYIFTHAGLTRYWIDQYIQPDKMEEIVPAINEMINGTYSRDNLAAAGAARGGLEPSGGPIWADYQYELIRDPYPGINQVVGHTRTNFLIDMKVGGNHLVNVNYLAYSDQPIYVLESEEGITY